MEMIPKPFYLCPRCWNRFDDPELSKNHLCQGKEIKITQQNDIKKHIKASIRANSQLLDDWKSGEISYGKLAEELSKNILDVLLCLARYNENI